MIEMAPADLQTFAAAPGRRSLAGQRVRVGEGEGVPAAVTRHVTGSDPRQSGQVRSVMR